MARGTSKRTRTQDLASQEIRRLWGEVEIVDAKQDLRVFIKPEDVAQATPKDAGGCVFARACQRAFGSTKVLFFRSVAYVELPLENGARRVERFHLPRGMRRLIEDFDQGKAVVPQAGFLLRKPSKSQSLNHLRRQQVERRKNRRMLLGTLEAGASEQTGAKGKGKYEDEPLVLDMAVRSGTGAVHFVKGWGRQSVAPGSGRG